MKFIKENLRVFIAVCIAIVLIVTGVVIILVNNEDKNDWELEQKQREEGITEVTGMSGNDAIEIVKKKFNGDNYDFFVEITDDSLYRVKVVSKTSDNTITYLVDPVNSKLYLDIPTN